MVLLENFGPAFAEAASRRQGGTFYRLIQSAEFQQLRTVTAVKRCLDYDAPRSNVAERELS